MPDNGGKPLLEVENLKVWFPIEEGFIASLLQKGEPKYVKAVDGLSLSVARGQIVGLAGESGCGKSTCGMVVVRLHEPSAGSIRFEGKDLAHLRSKGLKAYRRKIQIIFQDPYQSLNPRFTIYDTVKEPLDIHGLGTEEEKFKKVLLALERAELTPPETYLGIYPHQLSGGQRQRVVIARAIVTEPHFLVADEPTSMLDVSIRASILNLLKSFASEMDMGILYISHDLSTLRYICSHTAVMYLGRIVEIGPTEELIEKPAHPYVKALLSAVPVVDPSSRRERMDIRGEVLPPIDLPPGCRFRNRCPFAEDICAGPEPELADLGNQHWAACHFAGRFGSDNPNNLSE